MKFSFKFSNLMGSMYRKGNLIFTPDGNSVISPVGNRISIYDLKNNKSLTLPVESSFNFTTLQLSPDGSMLVAVNDAGLAHIISMLSRRSIHTLMLKGRVSCVRFSPDGKHFAITKGSKAFIYKTPGRCTGDYNPFVMERVYHAATDYTTCIDWSSDSRIIAIGSRDLTTRLYSLEKVANFHFCVLGGHTDYVVACFFEKGSFDLITVAKNGVVIVWECSIDPEHLRPYDPPPKKRRLNENEELYDEIDTTKAEDASERADALEQNETLCDNERKEDPPDKLSYKVVGKHCLIEKKKENLNVILTDAAYHKNLHILVTGFSNGSFLIHEMPDVNLVHSLCISDVGVSAIALNNTGDWIALGCSGLGQLLVWEWQSETYVMKQQSHFNNMSCLKYSPDGQYIVTGGDDGKVKLWNTLSSFCFVTFHEHTGSITAVDFSRNGKFVMSASLDGTVRAFDLTRYHNFRTFTSPRPVQFICLAMDSSSEFIAAGGQDVFEIYLWSMKIGRLVEILCGHEGPVVSIAFSPSLMSSCLVSVSWDKTLKIWNAIEHGSSFNTVQLTSDGLFVTFSPNGEEIAVATLNCHITFFDVKTCDQKGTIEGRNDLGSGISATDIISAEKNRKGKAFTTLCYSADGKCILAGGMSKYVCIYNVEETILMKKFQITLNRSLDGINEFQSRRKMSEFGNMALVEYRDRNEGGNVSISLPGVRKGDMASRSFKPEIRVYHLQFSPTGQAWAAATTEGILIYSLDVSVVFDPFELEINITPETVRENLAERKYSDALMASIKLNEPALIQEAMENVGVDVVEFIVRAIPYQYMLRTLNFAAGQIESSRHLEFYLTWVKAILTIHGPSIHGLNSDVMPILLTLQKNVTRKYDDLSRICDFNKYTLEYLITLGKLKQMKMESEVQLNAPVDINDIID